MPVLFEVLGNATLGKFVWIAAVRPVARVRRQSVAMSHPVWQGQGDGKFTVALLSADLAWQSPDEKPADAFLLFPFVSPFDWLSCA